MLFSLSLFNNLLFNKKKSLAVRKLRYFTISNDYTRIYLSHFTIYIYILCGCVDVFKIEK
jgi:hypothetical protein